MTGHDLGRLAALLRALPPVPAAWVRAAQELPAARRGLDDVVARAEADAEFRRALVSDLESALAAAGYELGEPQLQVLRERFASG